MGIIFTFDFISKIQKTTQLLTRLYYRSEIDENFDLKRHQFNKRLVIITAHGCILEWDHLQTIVMPQIE